MRYILPLLLLIIFTGCLPKQEDVSKIFQTKSASIIEDDYKQSTRYLILLKEKLDKRNPKSYDTNLANFIYAQVDTLSKNLYLKHNNHEIKKYKDYLQIAFSKDKIENRNDYLILGIYYLIHNSYEIEDGMQLTALTYNQINLETLYHNLQIIKWKIKTAKDLDGNYLFLTWQNNWQLELEKKIKNGVTPSWNEIENLKYIKEGKESIFGPSNFSFEVLLTQMRDRTYNSLKLMGVEPVEIGIETIKTIFLFL